MGWVVLWSEPKIVEEDEVYDQEERRVIRIVEYLKDEEVPW